MGWHLEEKIMKKSSYQLGMYEFSTKGEYLEAKKEQEAVELIRAKSDLSEPHNALRFYNKMIARKLFRTHIGYDFMKELRKTVVESGLVDEEHLYPLAVMAQKAEIIKKEPTKEEKDRKTLEEEAKRYRLLYEDLKARKNSSKVIIIFLVFIIAALTFITLCSDNTLITDYRAKVENEYVQWQQKLEAKEQELNEREEMLKETDSVQ